MTSCEANYFFNRVRVDKIIFYSYVVQNIFWVEAYLRRMTVPREFMGGRECEVVVLFIKFYVNSQRKFERVAHGRLFARVGCRLQNVC